MTWISLGLPIGTARLNADRLPFEQAIQAPMRATSHMEPCHRDTPGQLDSANSTAGQIGDLRLLSRGGGLRRELLVELAQELVVAAVTGEASRLIASVPVMVGRGQSLGNIAMRVQDVL